MYQSAKCQECGALFERTGQSLIYCNDCLERLDAEAQAGSEHLGARGPTNSHGHGHGDFDWPAVDEFSAAYQDWERNR